MHPLQIITRCVKAPRSRHMVYTEPFQGMAPTGACVWFRSCSGRLLPGAPEAWQTQHKCRQARQSIDDAAGPGQEPGHAALRCLHRNCNRHNSSTSASTAGKPVSRFVYCLLWLEGRRIDAHLQQRRLEKVGRLGQDASRGHRQALEAVAGLLLQEQLRPRKWKSRAPSALLLCRK